MHENSLFKGRFGTWDDRSEVLPFEFGQNMISEPHNPYQGEQHDYDPVKGWTIKTVQARPVRYSFESFCAGY